VDRGRPFGKTRCRARASAPRYGRSLWWTTRCADYRIGDGQEADGLADLLAAYDPSVTTKILRVTGVTVFAIIWALATVWAAMNIGYSVLEFVMTLWFD
jgi:hypothetical protein